MARFKAAPANRLQWRVVVRTAGRVDPARAALPLAWHLVQCTDPLLAEAHCAIGNQLMTDTFDPDGHCLTEGVCPRCAAAAEAAAATEAAETAETALASVAAEPTAAPATAET